MFVRWLEAQGVFYPEELREAHVGKWLIHATARPHVHTGMPRKTLSIFGETCRVRAFVAELVRAGVLPKAILNAFPRLRRPAILPRVTLRHTEVKKVIEGVATRTPQLHMLRTLMETAYSTAARPCELLRMDVCNVQQDRGLIRVSGKGDRERMVPIGRQAHRMLLNYIQAVRPLLLRWPEEKALWLTNKGTRLQYDRLLSLLHQHAGATHREKVTWYSFRRACATELARSGANIWAIKVLLGHEHLETVRHYP